MPEPSPNRSRCLLELHKRFHDAMQGQKFDEVAELCGMVKALFDRSDNIVGGGDPLPEQADLFDTVADLLSLADQPTAERLYERSLQIRQAFFGDRHRMVALSLDHLSAFYSAVGRAKDAQKFAERAKTLYEACLKDLAASGS